MALLAIVLGCAVLMALVMRWNSRREAPAPSGGSHNTDGGWSPSYAGDTATPAARTAAAPTAEEAVMAAARRRLGV